VDPHTTILCRVLLECIRESLPEFCPLPGCLAGEQGEKFRRHIRQVLRAVFRRRELQYHGHLLEAHIGKTGVNHLRSQRIVD
jgi:hypothetical protein